MNTANEENLTSSSSPRRRGSIWLNQMDSRLRGNDGIAINRKPKFLVAAGTACVLMSALLFAQSQDTAPKENATAAQRIAALEAGIAAAREQIQRVHDHDDVEILTAAYGYYLDKSLWDQLADLFADDGSIEIGTRGTYVGRERVRKFLHTAYGKEGPKEGVLANHLQLQPVIHVAPDGKTAKARVRLLFQSGRYGQSANWGGGVYENEYVKHNGVWQIKKVKAYTTFAADYAGGWAKSPRQVHSAPSTVFPPDIPPGPIVDSFPNVYDFPFHYDNPVTGRTQ